MIIAEVSATKKGNYTCYVNGKGMMVMKIDVFTRSAVLDKGV